MSTKPETLFRKKVVRDLESLEHVVPFSIQQVAIRGTPDLLVCLRGEFVALEIKSEDGEPSALQTYNINRINRCGGQAFVVYPDNWDKIFDLLKNIRRKKKW